MSEISVRHLHERRAKGDGVVLLDVGTRRVGGRVTLGVRPHSDGRDPESVGELSTDRDIAVLCHSGRRSALVVRFLRANGYPRALNVTGGIDEWSREIDPEVPRY